MAATDQLTRPILMKKKRRGYGRCDYERFDHITTSHVNAGRGKIGEVEVDCRFSFTKSRWGYLRSEYDSAEIPGGIIYLDLDFRQPSDCRLRAATVVVTLTDHEDERRQRSTTHQTSRPVKFTTNYGPRYMRGAERAMQKRTVKQFIPHVEVMGQGAGGLGVSKEQLLITTSRWKFDGHLRSTKGSNWDNKLEWVLEENLLEDQSMHKNLIHTAFAFEHNASRFFMTVEVTGKLVRTRDQIRQSLRFKDEEKAVTIKFEWKNGYSCPALLDKIARDLPLAMELENQCNVPAEIPDALPVNFSEATNSTLRPWTGHPTTPLPPQSTFGADVRQGIQIDTQISIPRILDPSQTVPEPSDDMMRLAAGLAPTTSSEPSELFSPGTGTIIGGDETVVESTPSPRLRRTRSRSYQPSQLSASTTLVGEDEEEPTGALDPWHMFVLEWLGRMGFLFLDFLASLVGFSLELGLKRKRVTRTTKGMRTGKDLPIETPGESGEETDNSPTRASSPTTRRDRNRSESKSRESDRTEGSLGVSTPMCVASSETCELDGGAEKGISI